MPNRMYVVATSACNKYAVIKYIDQYALVKRDDPIDKIQWGNKGILIARLFKGDYNQPNAPIPFARGNEWIKESMELS